MSFLREKDRIGVSGMVLCHDASGGRDIPIWHRHASASDVGSRRLRAGRAPAQPSRRLRGRRESGAEAAAELLQHAGRIAERSDGCRLRKGGNPGLRREELGQLAFVVVVVGDALREGHRRAIGGSSVFRSSGGQGRSEAITPLGGACARARWALIARVAARAGPGAGRAVRGGVRCLAGGSRGISFNLDVASRRGRNSRLVPGGGRGRSTRLLGQPTTSEPTTARVRLGLALARGARASSAGQMGMPGDARGHAYVGA